MRGESVVTEGILEINSGINLCVFLSDHDVSLIVGYFTRILSGLGSV